MINGLCSFRHEDNFPVLCDYFTDRDQVVGNNEGGYSIYSQFGLMEAVSNCCRDRYFTGLVVVHGVLLVVRLIRGI